MSRAYVAGYCTPQRVVDGTVEVLLQAVLFTPSEDADIAVFQCLILVADIAECASVSTVLEDTADDIVEHFLQVELRDAHDVLFRFPDRRAADGCCREILELKASSSPTPAGQSHIPYFSDYLGLTASPPAIISPPPLTLNAGDKPAVEFGGRFLLTSESASDMRDMLPLEFRFSEFRFLFSPKLHGISVPAFFRRCEEYPYPSVVVVKEAGGCCVFGAFCKAPWAPLHRYFGSTETFVFSLQRKGMRDVGMYGCTGTNRLFQFADDKSIAIGGGSKRSDAAIAVHSDWLRGSSGACETFGTPKPLSCKHDFVIADIEFWAIIPETVSRPGKRIDSTHIFPALSPSSPR